MDHRLQLVGLALAAAAALATAPPAFAGYVSMPPPGGFSSGSPLTYGGQALATFVWANQKVSGLMGGSVGGTPWSMGFSTAAGSGAGAALAAAARAGAWGIAGVGLAWLAGYGLEWINGKWQKQDNPDAALQPVFWQAASGGAACRGAAPTPEMLKCGLMYQHTGGGSAHLWSGCTGTLAGNGLSYSGGCLYNGSNFLSQSASRSNCSGGTVYDPAVNACRTPGAGGYRDAVPADWLPVETASPIPDNVLNDARPTVAIPVDLPIYNPGESPKVIPTGAPQPKTGGGWEQPGRIISPAPTTGNPWRFDDQWRLVPVPNETGAQAPYTPASGAAPGTAPTPVVVVNPGGDTGGEEEEQKSQCELTPEASGCSPLGSGTGTDTPITTLPTPLTITPASGFGPSTVACPAPRQISVAGMTLSMPFTLLCQFADGLRPVLIGLAWIAAVMGFMGLSRKET